MSAPKQKQTRPRAFPQSQKRLIVKKTPYPRVKYKKIQKRVWLPGKFKKPLVSNKHKFNMTTSFEKPDYYNHFIKLYREGKNEAEIIKYAKNILKVPEKYSKRYWYGNIYHCANIVLGKIALKNKRMSYAKQYLLNSVDPAYIERTYKKNYSPQLASFGPDLALAYDLYRKHNQRAIVLAYFERVNIFWESSRERGDLKLIIDRLKDEEPHDPYIEEDNPDFPFPRDASCGGVR